jgi:hypothetical protein
MMLSEADARNLALRALDRFGGPRAVYRSPRHPFSPTGMRVLTLDDVEIRIRYGEISSPPSSSWPDTSSKSARTS